MKLLFSLLFSAASLAVSAQVLGPDTDKQINESIRDRVEKGKLQKMAPSLPLFKTELPKKEDLTAVPSQPGVYALPLDGMPCMVPDTNGLAAMPNAAPRPYPYRKDMPTRPYQKRSPSTK